MVFVTLTHSQIYKKIAREKSTLTVSWQKNPQQKFYKYAGIQILARLEINVAIKLYYKLKMITTLIINSNIYAYSKSLFIKSEAET